MTFAIAVIPSGQVVSAGRPASDSELIGRPQIRPGGEPAFRARRDVVCGDWRLLVFDNATDADVLRPYISASGAARVLATSSRQSVVNLRTIWQV
jgi:hypothetical protein